MIWLSIYLIGVPVAAYVIPRLTGDMAMGGFCFAWPLFLPLAAFIALSELGEKHSREKSQ